MLRRRYSWGWLSAALAFAPLSAHAQTSEPTETARAAYRTGAAAYDGGDYRAACQAFTEADTSVPNETVLKLAMTSCVRAEDAVRSMNLVERARVRGVLREVSEQATARFAARLSRVRVECERCTATVDGVTVELRAVTWLSTGPHVVELSSATGEREKRALWLSEGEYLSISPAAAPVVVAAPRPAPRPAPAPPLAPEPAPSPRVPASSGASPAWFWAGTGLTVAVSAAAVASGLDTLDKHDAFAKGPTDSGASAGRDAELRTNVLIGGAAVIAVVTAVVGLFVVEWSRPSAATTTPTTTQAAARL